MSQQNSQQNQVPLANVNDQAAVIEPAQEQPQIQQEQPSSQPIYQAPESNVNLQPAPVVELPSADVAVEQQAEQQNLAEQQQEAVAPIENNNEQQQESLIKPPPPIAFNKILARPGQNVGPTGNQIHPSICKEMIDLVKSGDIEAVLSKQQVYNIEVRDVTDIGQFNQNLVFSSVFIQNEEQIIKMMTVLIQMGVDLFQKDNLKQTSLYYACRDGKCKVIQFLVEQGLRVNDKDTYGQNAIYYAVNLGQFEAVKLMKNYGSEHDMVDDNGQTPLYYAIKSNRFEMFNYLLELGCNLSNVDTRGQDPVKFATKYNKQQLIDRLIEKGARVPPPKPAIVKPEKLPDYTQPKHREKQVPKQYVLQILEKGNYRPITEIEFDHLKKEMPEIAKYFEDGNENELNNMKIPQVPDSAPIQYHWEKVALRMITALMKNPKAWIFLDPVDPQKLGILDYHDIIKKPMDFGTIKENLKRHFYMNMQQFLKDIELVFENCILYNGESSQVTIMCKDVQQDYLKQCETQHVPFYIDE